MWDAAALVVLFSCESAAHAFPPVVVRAAGSRNRGITAGAHARHSPHTARAARRLLVRQSLPPPKVTPERLARSVVETLQQGIESVALGPVAEDVMRRYREDPMVLERELAQIRVG